MVFPHRFSPRRKIAVVSVLLAGIGLSFFIWWFVHQEEKARIHASFLSRAQTQAAVAAQRLRSYTEMVYSLRDAFIGQQFVTRQEFAEVADSLLNRHPGVQALEWVPIVPQGSRAAWEHSATTELGRPIVIRRRRPDGGMVPAPEAPEYFVIDYVEPLAGNLGTVGYDVTSAPTAPLLAAARQDRNLKVSRPLRLLQSGRTEAGPGIIFILPFSRGGHPVEGFVQGVFYLQTILAQANEITTNEALDSYYFEQAADGHPPVLLYASLGGAEPLPHPGAMAGAPALDNPADFHQQIAIGNTSWQVVIRPNAAWVARVSSVEPGVILAAGLTIAALLALFVNLLLKRTGSIEEQVRERTQQLHDSEARLQAILDHSPTHIFIKDLAGRYLLANERFVAFCGRPLEEILGRTDHDLFPPAEAAMHRANDARALAEGRPLGFEEPTLTSAGLRTGFVQKFPLLDEQGRAFALCGISTDITERKTAEAELQENRRQLSNLISQLPGVAFRCLFDEKMTVLFASEGMLALTGYPAEDFLAGRIHLTDLTVPADQPAIHEVIATTYAERRNFEIEYRITRRDGCERWVLVRGRPIPDDAGGVRFLEGLAIDVTALKQAEAEKLSFERHLLETQKLESLGVMAGGVAHDFNNLLTAVLGHASLALLALPPEAAPRHHLEQIEAAARRAADLCTQMLAYAGKGRISPGEFDLSALVQETAALLQTSICGGGVLELQLDQALPAVKGDATQLNQIVMNLVLNAADAVADHPAGRVIVRTFALQAGAALFQTALRQPKLPPGPYVGLEVADNGCGMPPEILARIFEPFFSTKFAGRGLGLSAVLGIVQSHRGAMFVESQAGAGSTFRLLLPAEAGQPAKTPAASSPTPAPAPPGAVLIIDDDEAIRMLTSEILDRQGLTVLVAADGAQGLEIFQQRHGEIGLILLDLTMPGLSGEQVLARLQELQARPRIVVMSGYSEEEAMPRCAALGAQGYLRKPFELHALGSMVRAHLR